MNCQNCSSEMIDLSVPNMLWCAECGALVKFYGEDIEEQWFIPKSVENAKKLVQELQKARDLASSGVRKLNHIAKEDADRVNWDERDR